MKNIRLLYFGYKHAPNGAAMFVKNLDNEKNFFRINNIDYLSYSLENNHSQSSINDNKGRKKLKTSIRQKIDYIKNKSLIISILWFYLICLRYAKIVVFNYKRNYDCNDIIICNDLFVAFYVQKYFSDNKRILIMHNDGDPLKMLLNEYNKFRYLFVRNTLEKRVRTIFESFDKIVFLSENAKLLFISLYPNYSAEKLVVIPNGIGTNYSSVHFKSARDKYVGVAIGTVCYRKGYDLLIEALSQLSKELKSKLLVYVLGEIKDSEILEKKTKNNLNSSLIFKGPCSSHDILGFLQESDFFILCSRDEGLPLSIIEAMKSGLPIFTTNVGSIPLLVKNGENGITFDPNVSAISDVLQNIANGKYDLQKMGVCSNRMFHEGFSIDRMILKYVELF